MKLRDPFVRLPMQFDMERLSREIAVFPEDAWKPQAQPSQGKRELSLISVNGNLDDETAFGPMRPTTHLAHCSYLTQVLASLDAVWGKTCLLRSNDGCGIERNADISYYGATHMRVHVPILAQPGTRFLCDGVEVHMGAGECWIVDTWREHRLVSERGGERIHLIADTVGSRALHGLFDKGRLPKHAAQDWSPRFVALSPAPMQLRFESINSPVIMTPWELCEHIQLLLAETRPHPKLRMVHEASDQFLATWRTLWARYGLDAGGRSAYRKALESFGQLMQRDAPELQLTNRTAFLQAMRNLVLERALLPGTPA